MNAIATPVIPLDRVFSKARKHSPSVATHYYVHWENKDKKITIYKMDNELNLVKGTTFELGDIAEYDRYNLIYTGLITKITRKTVTIESHGRVYRLDLNTFCWMNHKFNAEQVAAHNIETSYSI